MKKSSRSRHIIIKLVFTLALVLCFGLPQQNYGNYLKISDELLSLKEAEDIDDLLIRDNRREVDSLLDIFGRRYRFNGQILISHNHKIISNKAYGYKNFNPREPLSTEDAMQLASVSKQFTAIAIMILMERGQLSYEDSAHKYIPDFPYKNITIRQLLTHTSGLPNYMWLLEHKWAADSLIPDNQDMLRMLAAHNLGLYFTPGRRFDYSNTGYAILAAIAENISGKSFAEFCRTNIFEPLAMDNTYIYAAAKDSIHDDKAGGYYRRWRYYRKIGETLHDGIVGDKGVYSTAGDLYKWDESLYKGRLVSKESLEEAFTPVKLRNRYPIPYGFGFRIRNIDGKKLIYHYGKWEGARSAFLRYVDEGFSIIIINNTTFRGITSLAYRMRNSIRQLPDYEFTGKMAKAALNHGVDEAMDVFINECRENLEPEIYAFKFIEIAGYFHKLGQEHKERKMRGLFYSYMNYSGKALAYGSIKD